jgi:hypothetical protein
MPNNVPADKHVRIHSPAALYLLIRYEALALHCVAALLASITARL